MREVTQRMREYEAVLKDVCNVGDFNYLGRKEWEGYLGVACMLAYIRDGVPATLPAIANHLGYSQYYKVLETAFDRLKINGVFGALYRAKDDPAINWYKNVSLKPKKRTSNHEAQLAWAHVAGIAGNFIGLKEEKRKNIEKEVEGNNDQQNAIST